MGAVIARGLTSWTHALLLRGKLTSTPALACEAAVTLGRSSARCRGTAGERTPPGPARRSPTPSALRARPPPSHRSHFHAPVSEAENAGRTKLWQKVTCPSPEQVFVLNSTETAQTLLFVTLNTALVEVKLKRNKNAEYVLLWVKVAAFQF